ncbi:hypothetical protein L218DRAFT_992944 [Marasmius fiardii PR-910]|nr:hypothetical protein L218DRAFT_992944 [Marasmius fiardii PR-910]
MSLAQVVIDTPLLDVGCTLGEGPVYDVETSTLHFVDIEQRKVHHLHTLTNTLTVDEYSVPVTSLALRRKKSGALAATTAEGFALLNPPLGVEYLSRPLPAEIVGLSRFNDGACDSRGRYFAGTVYSPKHGIPGKLYRYDPSNGSAVVVDQGPFTDSNGLGWSLDEKLFYFTDSWANRIYVYDYDIETGGISNRRVFTDAGDFGYSGVCDGLCLDTEGGVWSARWEGSRIVRFNSSGTPDFEIVLPTVFRVTSCCFGGPNLDQLYITSAHCGSVNGDASKQNDYPHSGHLFVVNLSGKFKGAPRHPFD